MQQTFIFGLMLMVSALAWCEDECADLNLPDLLKLTSGEVVDSSRCWLEKRRPEIIDLFESEMYGRAPVGRPEGMTFYIVETRNDAMAGSATLKQVKIAFFGPGGKGSLNLTLFLPNKRSSPVPVFLLICHRDRENIDPERMIRKPFWPAERLIGRGYGAATFHVSDIDPDEDDGFKNGVHGLFDPPKKERSGDAWGTLAAWAWGGSRAMDYLEQDSDVDSSQVAVVGHSRGGKAALWCGATDDRFAMVISNDSGCSGAALSRRKEGERLKVLNTNFPHWFCKNYKSYNDREEALPFDQHALIALIAPRLAYIASAQEDGWADPKGEFLAARCAGPVYQLLGKKGLDAETFPPVNSPLHSGRVGYHLRTGGHDLTLYDWQRFMDFADRWWGRK